MDEIPISAMEEMGLAITTQTFIALKKSLQLLGNCSNWAMELKICSKKSI